jgi:predicted nuclease with TOPRIM domain
MRENSWEKEVEHQKKINSILSGSLANPIIERLRGDYVSVCNDRADLQYKLQRYENTDIDRENKRLQSEIKCLKFKIEELEREKAELIQLLDRYDVFFKSLSKE